MVLNLKKVLEDSTFLSWFGRGSERLHFLTTFKLKANCPLSSAFRGKYQLFLIKNLNCYRLQDYRKSSSISHMPSAAEMAKALQFSPEDEFPKRQDGRLQGRTCLFGPISC
jgi:hypothetical protein